MSRILTLIFIGLCYLGLLGSLRSCVTIVNNWHLRIKESESVRITASRPLPHRPGGESYPVEGVIERPGYRIKIHVPYYSSQPIGGGTYNFTPDGFFNWGDGGGPLAVYFDVQSSQGKLLNLEGTGLDELNKAHNNGFSSLSPRPDPGRYYLDVNRVGHGEIRLKVLNPADGKQLGTEVLGFEVLKTDRGTSINSL